MLELKNITINHIINDRTIIENFTFTLNNYDKAVIIGEEGNGKSTLLKYIYDEMLIDDYCKCSGKIIKKGKISYLPQTFEEKYLNYTIKEYFKGININLYIDKIKNFNLPLSFFSSNQIINTLSGGEKVKISLAKLLMSEPDILLLDEPTNDIDINMLVWLEDFIINTKIPILFISHDETLIENAANVIIHIEQIPQKEQKSISKVTITHSSYSDYIKDKVYNFGRQMQVATKERSDYNKQMDKWTQVYNRVDYELNAVSRQDPSTGRLLKKKMKSVKSQEKRLKREAENFTEIPQMETTIITKFSDDIYIPRTKEILNLNLEKLVVGEKILTNNIKLSIFGNEHIGITGNNGVGKSTLLKEIYNLLKDRRDINVSYMSQDYSTTLDYDKTPVEYLADNYTKEEITKARTYMGSMRFTKEEMLSKIKSLSGGQKAKILFLDMVLKNSNVLILDEPTRNFSPLSNPVIRNTLREFKGVIISVSHDRKYLDEVCDKVYELTFDGIILV